MNNEQTPAAEQPLFAKPAAAKKEGGNSKTGLIVGICCGAGALIILVVVLIIVLVANGGKSVNCEKTAELEGGKQTGGVTVKFDNDENLTSMFAWEEDYSNEVIKDEEWEEVKKSYENYDKDAYVKYDISKVDDHTIRLEIEPKITDEHKSTYGTPEKAKKALEASGFTCKD